MAGNHLIDGYLAELARRLPADAVDELADGLTETYLRYRSDGLDPDPAARAAIAEFGEAELVLAAFVRQAPGRRTAWALLFGGPVVGVWWAATLIVGRAWTWPVPGWVGPAIGAMLLVAIAMLVLAATGRRSYRRTRLAAGAGLVVIGLDGAILATMALVAPPFVWPLALAVPASLTRVTLTARVMPRLLRN
jgi:hypothetical protein